MTSAALDLSADVVGGWLQLPSAATAELMGTVGFGFLCIDQQHGMIGPDALMPMLQGLAASGTPALVRVPSNEQESIGRALDHDSRACCARPRRHGVERHGSSVEPRRDSQPGRAGVVR